MSDNGNTGTVVSLRQVGKNYGGLTALSGVDLGVNRHEVMALVGDNGAGKSTLVKIISGVEQPDHGSITVMDQEAKIDSPRDARRLRIATLHQSLGLVDCFNVVENIFLGREIVGRSLGILPCLSHAAMRRRADGLMERLGIRLRSLDQPVSTMSGGQRQAVAISRLLLDEPNLIIMDEPMAALGVDEGMKILNLVSQLARQGISILIISHNLEHVFTISNRIAVLKNGRLVGVVETARTNRQEITSMIVNGA
ncbi:MAG: ribose transport system ATP-binding protein [Rhodospirillaceae bacterium]|jgi:ABC-type sugar transport system ATPase subunit|nr:ribose transport system ATP-binding protein [Rhodospirillaceae bacterium]